MRFILSVVCICIWVSSFAQTKIGYENNSAGKSKPMIYSDSILVAMEYTFMDVNKIENFDVKKDALSDKVYMILKNTERFNFFTYSDLKNIYFSKINKPILLLVNGNFVKNPAKINIDSSYIYKVEVESGNDFEELKNLYPDMAIVNIKVNNLNNKNGDRQISLQGMPLNSFPQ